MSLPQTSFNFISHPVQFDITNSRRKITDNHILRYYFIEQSIILCNQGGD